MGGAQPPGPPTPLTNASLPRPSPPVPGPGAAAGGHGAQCASLGGLLPPCPPPHRTPPYLPQHLLPPHEGHVGFDLRLQRAPGGVLRSHVPLQPGGGDTQGAIGHTLHEDAPPGPAEPPPLPLIEVGVQGLPLHRSSALGAAAALRGQQQQGDVGVGGILGGGLGGGVQLPEMGGSGDDDVEGVKRDTEWESGGRGAQNRGVGANWGCCPPAPRPPSPAAVHDGHQFALVAVVPQRQLQPGPPQLCAAVGGGTAVTLSPTGDPRPCIPPPPPPPRPYLCAVRCRSVPPPSWFSSLSPPAIASCGSASPPGTGSPLGATPECCDTRIWGGGGNI